MRIKNLPSIESMDGSQDALVIEQTDGSEDKSRKVSPAQIKQYVLGNSIDDIYSVMGQNGAKNLIPYPYYHTSKTTAGITITDNGDGTLTFNGTSTSATVIFRMISNDANIEIPLNKSKYILTWVDSSEHKRYFRIDIALAKSDGTTVVVNGESGVINIDNTNGEYKGIYSMGIFTANNLTVTNLTFKPMLRLASDTDNTYQPYAMTNKQLTEEIGDLSQTGLTGESVAEQLEDLNDDLVLESFTPTLSSAMGTPNEFNSNCFYNSKTKQVHLDVLIYSSSALIPTVNATIMTIPAKYRPSATVYLGFATVMDNNSFAAQAERCWLSVSGDVGMSNFVYGGKPTRVFAIKADYISA